jgi:hypothetical protein
VGSNGLNHSRIQTVQNKFKCFQIFGQSEKHFPLLGKIKIKYGFEDVEVMNNFFHRNFNRFRMDLELKFREFSRLEFD